MYDLKREGGSSLKLCGFVRVGLFGASTWNAPKGFCLLKTTGEGGSNLELSVSAVKVIDESKETTFYFGELFIGVNFN